MSSRDWLTLVLRAFGVWQLIETVEYLATAFCVTAHFYKSTSASFDFYMVATFVHFFLAVWLLKFAPSTARFFYPDEASSDSSADKAEPNSNASPPPTI